MTCPCGVGEDMASCCGPLIAGERHAESAEQLMRSRYSAYVMQAIHYLEATHDPARRRDFDVDQAASWARKADWQSLEVLKVEGAADGERAFVEFIARYSADGEAHAHHERSRFRRVDERWVYVDGVIPSAKRAMRVGRNERCPCGSGKKYKRCCGRG